MPMGLLPRSVYYLGLDLGLRRNPSALAVLEEVTRATGRWDAVNLVKEVETLLVLRDVRPLPLNLPYAELPGLVERYLGLLKPGFPVHLAVDASGVGLPVVELFERARLAADLHPIVITGGERVGRSGKAQTVPRDALLQNVRIRLECRDFRIAAGLEHYEELKDELASLGGRANHPDDLAFALALALWQARPGPSAGERPEILPGAPVAPEERRRRWEARMRERHG